MIRNAEYWKRRSEALMQAAHRKADRSIADIEKMYRDAEHRVVQEIERWYARFAVNNEITLAEARKLLNTRQLEEFRWTVERYIKEASKANISPELMKKLENASAKFHVTRLESVQLGIQQEIERLYGNQLDQVDTLLRGVVSEGYTRQCYEIQKGVGLGWDIAKMNRKALDNLLAKPWTADGRTFSQRIWGARDTLIGDLQSELIQGILRGDSPQRITDRVQKRFGVSRRQAGRLIHTETTYFHAMADKESYRELGVDEIEILETLDSLTCEICAPLDGTKLPRSQMEPGVTVPPFHPNCRGTTVPVVDESIWGVGERAARDEDGNVYTVPGDMTYEEWKKTFQEGGSKEGLSHLEKTITGNDDEKTHGSRAGSKNQAAIEKRRKQAEERARELGVQADYSRFTPELAETVNQCIEDSQKKYGAVPTLKNVGTYDGDRDGYAFFNKNTGTLFLKNTSEPDIMEIMKQDAQDQFDAGGWSTGDARHVIFHEIGHAYGKHYLTSEKKAAIEKLRRVEMERITGDPDTDIMQVVREAQKDNENGAIARAKLTQWGKAANKHLSLYGIVSVEETVSESIAALILEKQSELAQKTISAMMGGK